MFPRGVTIVCQRPCYDGVYQFSFYSGFVKNPLNCYRTLTGQTEQEKDRDRQTERQRDGQTGKPVTVMCALAKELPAALSAWHEYSPESSTRADWMLSVPS